MTQCHQCGTEFRASKSTARFCSARCRVAAHRAASKPGASVVTLASRRKAEEVVASVGSIEDAVKLELGAMVSTTLGQQALLLARRLDWGSEPSGSAVASLSKQLTDVMARALAQAAASDETDPLVAIQHAAAEVRRKFARGA